MLYLIIQLIWQGLTPEEKRFILLVERGDCASVDKMIKMYRNKPKVFEINCLDPLGRNGLSIAIINENPEMMELLLAEGIQVKDALLLAISEEYVEGVELLLSDEEKNHEQGKYELRLHLKINSTNNVQHLFRNIIVIAKST